MGREPGSSSVAVTRRSPRTVARVFAAAVVAALFPACAGIFGLDEIQDASTELCDLLARCNDDRSARACDEHVSRGLSDGSDDARVGWMTAFADMRCLENCTAARRCLDRLPVCRADACAVRDDCCGFLTGRTDCAFDTGTCCKRKGTSCDTDDECCPGEGTCSSSTRTCGGVFCQPPSAPCVDDFECCTGRCDAGLCAETICGGAGFDCDEDADCCDGFCEPASSRCAIPGCGVLGAACGGPTACCGELICHLGICSDAECFPLGGDCVTDTQCCSGHCDPSFFLCGAACAEDGAMCLVAGECCGGACDGGVCGTIACSMDLCQEDADCCSGACEAGVCVDACGGVGCGHSACEIGDPLDAGCDPCASAVCSMDPFCCCSSWDSLCVAEAVAACGACG